MKITALGVHSAFATGLYQDAVPVEEVYAMLRRMADAEVLQNLPEEELLAEIRRHGKRLYAPKWHSNFLIEFDMPSKRGKGTPYRLLMDLGGDIRHSLKAIGLNASNIDGVYISHPHNDHIGGMEYMGLMTLFNPNYTEAKREWLGGSFIADKLFLEHAWWPIPPANARPDLFIHRKVLTPLRRAVGPGLDTVQGVPDVTLETYFDIHLIGKQDDGQTKSHVFQDGSGHWTMTPIFALHVISSSEEMASYGICLQHSSGYNILMPSDTQHVVPPQLEAYYRRASRIYMDCETSAMPSGVHPHVSDLIHRMSPDLQRKCLLYHYDTYPEVPEGMFCGILQAGDSHSYPE
jgi:hypothetical protein